MNTLKTAYFAGLIDGEGAISYKSGGVVCGSRPTIKVKMTCQKTIEALRNHFGVGNITYVAPPLKFPHHLPSWQWAATHKSAIFVIETVLPYLITKQHDAEFVLTKRFVKKQKAP